MCVCDVRAKYTTRIRVNKQCLTCYTCSQWVLSLGLVSTWNLVRNTFYYGITRISVSRRREGNRKIHINVNQMSCNLMGRLPYFHIRHLQFSISPIIRVGMKLKLNVKLTFPLIIRCQCCKQMGFHMHDAWKRCKNAQLIRVTATQLFLLAARIVRDNCNCTHTWTNVDYMGL